MIEEMTRHRCTSSDGTTLLVIERHPVFTTHGDVGTRRRRGVPWVTLLNGEPVCRIDADTFEVVATGERLTHDRGQCCCTPAARFSTSIRSGNVCRV